MFSSGDIGYCCRDPLAGIVIILEAENGTGSGTGPPLVNLETGVCMGLIWAACLGPGSLQNSLKYGVSPGYLQCIVIVKSAVYGRDFSPLQ